MRSEIWSPLRVGDDTDEAQGAGADIAVAMALVRGDIEGHTGPHGGFALRPFGNPLPFQDEDFVLVRVLVRGEDGSRGKFYHPHSEVGRALGLSDHPADGDAFSGCFRRNVVVITEQDRSSYTQDMGCQSVAVIIPEEGDFVDSACGRLCSEVDSRMNIVIY